jgi:hypothetical protein
MSSAARRAAILLIAALVRCHPAAANWLMPMVDPATACKMAIAGAEGRSAIPPQLLAAIGRVESGRRDPLTGAMVPWPWTIDAEGQGHFFETKAQAIAAVQALQARGVRSIDVGCLQVNLMHHPDAFASLDQAFDPVANANYAARFLTQLHDQLGNWPRAAGAYHSQTPERGDDYERRVMAAWPQERQLAGSPAPLPATAGLAGPTRPFPAMTGPLSAGAVFGGGQAAFALNSAAPHAHIIPLAVAGGSLATNHGLDFYRSRPIPTVTR